MFVGCCVCWLLFVVCCFGECCLFVFGVGCWVLGVGRCFVGRWVLGGRCSLFVVRCPVFFVLCSLLVVRCHLFVVRCSLFVVRCLLCVVICYLLFVPRYLPFGLCHLFLVVLAVLLFDV